MSLSVAAPAAINSKLLGIGTGREDSSSTNLERLRSSVDVAAAVDLAIADVCREGSTDLLPRQFEVDAMAYRGFRSRMHGRVLDSLHNASAPGRVELMHVAKRIAFGRRRISILELEDTILFLSLCILAAPLIEAKRVPASAERVFSYRFAPTETSVFDPEFGYRAFIWHANDLAHRPGIGVVGTADIENFYERISLPVLNDALCDCGIDAAVVERIAGLVAHWNTNGGGPGLPIGSNASRILSEATLIAVDAALLEAGIDFIRFVDDFRFFAPSVEVGRDWLNIVMSELAAKGLSLNPHKTSLQPSRTASPGTVAGSDASSIADASTKDSMVDPRPRRRAKNSPRSAPDLFRPWRYEGSLQNYIFPDVVARSACTVDLAALRTEILDGSSVTPTADIRLFVVAAIERSDRVGLTTLPAVMMRHPHVASFCVSGLLRRARSIPADLRVSMARSLAEILASEMRGCEGLKLEIIRLLGSSGYADPGGLTAYVLGVGCHRDTYLVRLAIDALRGIGGSRHRDRLADRAARLGSWSQRALLAWATADGVLDEEPWRGLLPYDLWAQELRSGGLSASAVSC